MRAIELSAEAGSIAPESREFLLWLFTDLRKDLAHQFNGGGTAPDPKTVARTIAIYDALLGGLSDNRLLFDSDEIREYVAGLARATDEENEYERVSREHTALAELCNALGE